MLRKHENCFLPSQFTNRAIKQQGMFDRILACFLNKFRHSDVNIMDEHHHYLFPLAPKHITMYCLTLGILNKSIGTKELQSYQVSTFNGFKIPTLSKHEYGWAYVLGPSTKTFTLSFERMQGKTIDVDKTSSKSLNTEPEASNPITYPRSDLCTFTAQIISSSKTSLNSLHSKTSLNLSSTSLSPQRFADDWVATLPESGKWNSDDRHLFTLTFKSKPLYLYELAFLVEATYQENESYNLLTNNCYHLVGMVAGALKITHNAHVAMSEENEDVGKCCGVNFFAKGRQDITTIVQRYYKHLDGFVSFLYVLSDWSLYIFCYSGKRVTSRGLPLPIRRLLLPMRQLPVSNSSWLLRKWTSNLFFLLAVVFSYLICPVFWLPDSVHCDVNSKLCDDAWWAWPPKQI